MQGQILAQYESSPWVYILPDHLGSVRQLVGSDSQVDLAQSFDPFGVPFETSGSGESDFGYTGAWWDSEVGLLYLRARYYDPYLNRFISPDTIIPDFRNPQSLNRYMYVLGNPLRYRDPSGHIECVDADCDLVMHPISGRVFRRSGSVWPVTSMPTPTPTGMSTNTPTPAPAWTPTGTPTLPPTCTPTPTATSTPTPDERAADVLFDPWGGSSYLPRSDARVVEYEADMRARRYDLYEAQGLDLEAIAQRAENNPLNEPEYYVVGLEPTLLVRANHVPYQMFLKALNLGTDNGLYPFNYEPNYLEALMAAQSGVLRDVKRGWLALPPEQREIQNLIYTGSPG